MEPPQTGSKEEDLELTSSICKISIKMVVQDPLVFIVVVSFTKEGVLCRVLRDC